MASSLGASLGIGASEDPIAHPPSSSFYLCIFLVIWMRRTVPPKASLCNPSQVLCCLANVLDHDQGPLEVTPDVVQHGRAAATAAGQLTAAMCLTICRDDQNEDVAAVAEAAEAEDEELQEAIRQSLISGGKPSHGRLESLHCFCLKKDSTADQTLRLVAWPDFKLQLWQQEQGCF